MLKRIYWILGVLSIAVLAYFIINPAIVSIATAVWIVTIAYIVFIGSFYGILAHTLTAHQKGSLIIYPVLMGILFGVFAAIYIFVLLPLIMPGYL